MATVTVILVPFVNFAQPLLDGEVPETLRFRSQMHAGGFHLPQAGWGWCGMNKLDCEWKALREGRAREGLRRPSWPSWVSSLPSFLAAILLAQSGARPTQTLYNYPIWHGEQGIEMETFIFH